MKTKNRIVPALLGSAASFILASAVQAALVGPNLTYSNINEFDSQLFGPPPVESNPTGLFGTPVLNPPNSDNLSFPTSTFNVLIADGQFEEQDGKLTLDITPTSLNNGIDALTFDEGGAWRVVGDASVEATLLFNNLEITSVNGLALNAPIVVAPTFSQTITTQNGGAATLQTNTGDVGANGNASDSAGIWDITATFNLDAALAHADLSGNVTGVSVALDNQLLGDSNTVDNAALNLAEIDKKHITISGTTLNPVVTAPGVPEPASFSLFIGAAALAMRRRRTV